MVRRWRSDPARNRGGSGGSWCGERRGTGRGRGVFIGGGVLGGGGEGIRDPEKIGIPAAARLGVGRKKKTRAGRSGSGTQRSAAQGERGESGRPRRRGSGRARGCWASLARRWAEGERERES